jgi:chromate transporter
MAESAPAADHAGFGASQYSVYLVEDGVTSTLISLAAIFAELSLLAFGGGNTTLPEMQRQVVDVHGWMSASDFSAVFALARAAPGPNLMIVPLLGWRVGGLPGLLVSSVAMFGPSSIVMGLVLGLWRRFKDNPWRRIVQAGLVPVTVGLVAASASIIARASDGTWGLAAITGIAAAASLGERVNPLLVLAAGAVAGLGGIGRF